MDTEQLSLNFTTVFDDSLSFCKCCGHYVHPEKGIIGAHGIICDRCIHQQDEITHSARSSREPSLTVHPIGLGRLF